MLEEKSCGAIVYNNEGEVLIVQHNAGHWDFPKGHVENNETEVETAVREVKEETNIDIQIPNADYRYEIYYNPKENVNKTVVFFLARNISKKTIKQDAEIKNIGWYSYDEAMDILTYNDAKKLLKLSYEDFKRINN